MLCKRIEKMKNIHILCCFLQCSATCGDGTSMRAVKCRVSTSLLDDAVCDASKRPLDTRPCQLGSCPTTAPLTTTTTTPPAPRAAFWRFGSWTEVRVLVLLSRSLIEPEVDFTKSFYLKVSAKASCGPLREVYFA